MFIALFILWVIWNGRLTVEIAVLGILLCGAVYAFCYKFLDLSPRRELQSLRLLPKRFSYVLHLIGEVVQANLDVAGMILRFDEEPEPELVRFRTPAQTETGQVVIANSITLTPGTFTVDLMDGTFLVHGLDKSLLEDIDNSEFVRRVVEMEQQMDSVLRSDEKKEGTDV